MVGGQKFITYIKSVNLINNIFFVCFRVPSGSEEFQWLFREASIVNYQPCDEDANYVLMRVVITKAKLGKFVKTFQ